MLNTFRKAALRNAQYIDVMSSLLSRFQNITAITHRDWARALATLSASVKKLDEHFKPQQGSDITAEISEADTTRDKAYITFAAIVRAQADAGVTEAVRLQKIISKYNVNVHSQMDEESSLIKQMDQEVENVGYMALAKMGVANHWGKVVASTNTLTTLLNRRDDERATQQYGLVKADRAAIDIDYDRCAAIINAALLYEPSQQLTDSVAQANSYINRVRTQMIGTSAAESEEVSGSAPADTTETDGTTTAEPNGQTPSQGGTTTDSTPSNPNPSGDGDGFGL